MKIVGIILKNLFARRKMQEMQTLGLFNLGGEF